MKHALSRIYFDDRPLTLPGDESRPRLDRIVRAGGKEPGRVDVLVLQSPKDQEGQLLAPGEVIDRTVEPAKPIYLRSVARTQPTLDVYAPADAAEPAHNDPVISQLGRDPEERAERRDAAKQAKKAEGQARAEDEAEERQEEDREQQGELQDEDEDRESSKRDRRA